MAGNFKASLFPRGRKACGTLDGAVGDFVRGAVGVDRDREGNLQHLVLFPPFDPVANLEVGETRVDRNVLVEERGRKILGRPFAVFLLSEKLMSHVNSRPDRSLFHELYNRGAVEIDGLAFKAKVPGIHSLVAQDLQQIATRFRQNLTSRRSLHESRQEPCLGIDLRFYEGIRQAGARGFDPGRRCRR